MIFQSFKIAFQAVSIHPLVWFLRLWTHASVHPLMWLLRLWMQLTDTYAYSNINLANTWQSTILGEKRSCSKLVNIGKLAPGSAGAPSRSILRCRHKLWRQNKKAKSDGWWNSIGNAQILREASIVAWGLMMGVKCKGQRWKEGSGSEERQQGQCCWWPTEAHDLTTTTTTTTKTRNNHKTHTWRRQSKKEKYVVCLVYSIFTVQNIVYKKYTRFVE